jgi:hypothetical protein
MSPSIALFLAVLVLLSAGATWYALVRPVPQQAATGVIASKTFQPAHTIKRFQGGAGRESWTQEEFRVPDGYVFQLDVDGSPPPVYYSCDARASAGYEVGQKVRVEYEERGFPLMSKRIRVIGMARADAP